MPTRGEFQTAVALMTTWVEAEDGAGADMELIAAALMSAGSYEALINGLVHLAAGLVALCAPKYDLTKAEVLQELVQQAEGLDDD
jgi:hypothetical protein